MQLFCGFTVYSVFLMLSFLKTLHRLHLSLQTIHEQLFPSWICCLLDDMSLSHSLRAMNIVEMGPFQLNVFQWSRNFNWYMVIWNTSLDCWQCLSKASQEDIRQSLQMVLKLLSLHVYLLESKNAWTAPSSGGSSEEEGEDHPQ